MADTQILQDLEFELTGEELEPHFVCGACYPDEVPFGSLALCGAKLAGIPLAGAGNVCDTCMKTVECPVCGYQY